MDSAPAERLGPSHSVDLNFTTPAAPGFVNKGLDQSHRFRQYPELEKSECRVSISPLRCSCHLVNARMVLVTEVVLVKDPGTCLHVKWALNNARSTPTAGKANIKPGSCHLEQ